MAGIDELGTIVGDLKRQNDDSTRPQLGKGGDPITWLEIYSQNIEVENSNIFSDQCDINGSYLIWDHNGSNGFWDVGSWATQSTATGSPEFICSRLAESALHQYFTEEFDNTSYKDNSNTTADWNSTGSCVFIVGSETAQSLKTLGSDVRLGSFNRVTVNGVGSNLNFLDVYVSLNGGSFTKVNFGEETTFTSNLGSDVRWKLVLNTGT